MQMVKMVTESEHVYAGHRLFPGEEYECEEQHVDLMRKLGWSREARKRSQSYQTRDMTAKRGRKK